MKQIGDFLITDYGSYKTETGFQKVIKKQCTKCGHVSLISYMPTKKQCECNGLNCKENHYIQYIGKTIGDMKIMDYDISKSDFIVKCICCGRVKKARMFNLFDEKQDTRKHKNCILNIDLKNKKQNSLYKKFQNTWLDIVKRIKSEKPEIAKYYKNKNIQICERWEIFINFYDDLYDDFLKFNDLVKEGTKITIDRIDSNKNYEPSNIRWATPKLQSLNAVSVKNKNKIYMIKNKEEIILEESISSFCKKNPEYNDECIYLYIKNNKTFYKDIYITKI